MKAEDNSKVYPPDNYKVPDYRVVLPDGAQWLVEVKNKYIKDPQGQKDRFMTPAYREKLENYASATGGQLKLAVYWARWRIWTLISPERFLDRDGYVTVDMLTALMKNEMVSLGDQAIGTRPPLRVLLDADPCTSGPIEADGTVKFTISGVRLFCDEDEIVDPIEKNLAWMFIRYGGWREDGPHAVLERNRLQAVEFRWDPEERTNRDFEIIGTLSEMFCRYYAEQTIADREIVQIHASPRPAWFEPLVSAEYTGKALPLWQLKLHPKHHSMPETDDSVEE